MLDEKIEFPIMQLKNIITAAKQNKKVYNSNIFLGSELQDTYNVVSAIIGPLTPKKIVISIVFLFKIIIGHIFSLLQTNSRIRST